MRVRQPLADRRLRINHPRDPVSTAPPATASVGKPVEGSFFGGVRTMTTCGGVGVGVGVGVAVGPGVGVGVGVDVGLEVGVGVGLALATFLPQSGFLTA
jgi:hypothetical protein